MFLKGKLSGLHQASRTQQELLFWINSETEFPLSQSHTALHVCDFKENSPYCMVSFSQWGANIRCEHYQICVKKSWSEFNQILCRHSVATKSWNSCHWRFVAIPIFTEQKLIFHARTFDVHTLYWDSVDKMLGPCIGGACLRWFQTNAPWWVLKKDTDLR